MSLGNGRFSELTELLEALCDDRLSPPQTARLEELVLGDREARQLYLEYIELHGTLCWDTAQGGEAESVAAPVRAAESRRLVAAPDGRSRRAFFSRRRISTAAIAAALLIGLMLFVQRQFLVPHVAVDVAADPAPPDVDGDKNLADGARPRERRFDPISPLRRPGAAEGEKTVASGTEPPVVAPNAPVGVADNTTPGDPPGRIASPVEFIDEQLAAGWTLAGVEPSPQADDAEWVRRVYLDVTGRIPPAEAVERFLKDRRLDKRAQLVDDLLDDPAYVAHWTTVWTNLLVGRAELPGDVSRPALERFLRRSFAGNRPWSEVIFDLVSAEGDNQENGAANFLLAHLNNDAVPATAVTARLFLGVQVQCTQCHHHPFNEWQQSEFWELNSCFQQTDVVREAAVDPQTGEAKQVARLVNRPVEGPIFYENRQNLVRAALPKFSGVSISPDASTNRRRELARLMVEGEQTQVALATVNRTWQHFFGHGFTRPVDDMGPHNPATHPALLDRLSRDFVAGGYDVKQLIRWICNSQAYQLSSRYGETNAADDPEAGEPPLFSRMYVKPMTVEQLYDSLLVATRLDESRGSRWDDSERRRRHEWLQQFVVTYETEENDEATTFSGTMPQALMMMNGELVQQAVSAQGDTYLKQVVAGRGSDAEKIRSLFLAALSRNPTPKELAAFRKLLRDRTAARGNNRQQAQAEGYQDLFWAVLNSSEFILVH